MMQDAPLLTKRIDQYSEPGKELQRVVQVKLKDFLGQDYADDVLPLYIVVMLAHGNQADLVTDNLEAFLGSNAQLFVQWYAVSLAAQTGSQAKSRSDIIGLSFRLFQHLAEDGDKYAAPDHTETRSATSSSHDGSSEERRGSEDGEASAMEQGLQSGDM